MRADHRDDRTEALLAEQLHRRRHLVDDVRRHQHALARAAIGEFGAGGDRIVDQALDVADGLGVHHRAERGRAHARIADRHGRDLRLEACDEILRHALDDDDPLGRHADLALVHEGAERGGLDRLVEIGVVQHDQRRLAAQFEQAGLQMLGRALGDDPADRGRSGEVDAAHRGMIDQRADHRARICRRIGDEIDDAGGEARLLERLDDQPVGARAQLRTLEDDGVAAGDRHRDRAHAEDDRRVPRRDAEHDARRLADRHGKAAGLVGGDHLARNLGGQGGGFAHHRCGEAEVEQRPALGGADLPHHRIDEIIGLGFQRGGSLHQKSAARIGAERAPSAERGRGGIARRIGIVDAGCGGLGRHLAGDGIYSIECVVCGTFCATNEKRNRLSRHDSSPGELRPAD